MQSLTLYCILLALQVVGKINSEGVFLEQLETNPAKYLPEVETGDLSGEVVQVS